MCVSEGCSCLATSFGCPQALVWRMSPVTCGLCEPRAFGLTTPAGLVGGHGGVSALSCATLQLLYLPDVGATPQQGEHRGLAPHLCRLVLAICTGVWSETEGYVRAAARLL